MKLVEQYMSKFDEVNLKGTSAIKQDIKNLESDIRGLKHDKQELSSSGELNGRKYGEEAKKEKLKELDDWISYREEKLAEKKKKLAEKPKKQTKSNMDKVGQRDHKN